MKITEDIRRFIRKHIDNKYAAQINEVQIAREKESIRAVKLREEMVEKLQPTFNEFVAEIRKRLERNGFDCSRASDFDIIMVFAEDGGCWNNIATNEARALYAKQCRLAWEKHEKEEELVVRASLGVDYDGLMELISKI